MQTRIIGATPNTEEVNGIINAIESNEALFDIEQKISLYLLKDKSYEEICCAAISADRLDVFKMVITKVPLCSLYENDDYYIEEAMNILREAIKLDRIDFIEWLLDNNPFFLDEKIDYHQHVIGACIALGKLDILKRLEKYETYRRMLNDTSSSIHNKYENCNDYGPGDHAPVITAINFEQLEILKWLVDEKNHSLIIPGHSYLPYDIMPIVCDVTDGIFERERAGLEDKEMSHLANGRLAILKWLVNDKKLPLTNRGLVILHPQREKKEVDLFEFVITQHDANYTADYTLFTFPIFEWLLTEKFSLFKHSICQSFSYSLPHFTLKVLGQELHAETMIRHIHKLIQWAVKSKEVTQDDICRFLLKVSAANRQFAQSALCHLHEYGLSYHTYHNIKEYLTEFATLDFNFTDDDIKLSDRAWKVIAWIINNDHARKAIVWGVDKGHIKVFDPIFSILRLVESQQEKITQLTERVKMLESAPAPSPRTESSFFQNPSRKRPNENPEETDQEHSDKRQRTF